MTGDASNDSAAPTTGDSPALAILLLLLAMFVFTAMDGFAKYLAVEGMPPERIILVRYCFAAAMLAPAIAWHWRTRPLATARPVQHVARGVLLIGSATLFVYSLRALPLETATAIGFVSPLYVTALSIIFLGEKVGVRRWMAVVVGFLGVLAILRPGTDAFILPMLIPLCSSLCWAGGLIITRAMRGNERPITILAWTTATGLLAIAPFGLAGWETPSDRALALLVVIALCHTAGQYLTIRAFMLASASVLAPFSYSTIIWATIIGAAAFGSLPDLPTALGALVLASAGLYVWHRERKVTGMPTVPGGSISEAAQDAPAPESTDDGARRP